MRKVLAPLLVAALASRSDPSSPPDGPLTAAEIARARSVPSTGDAQFIVDGRDYVGSALIGIDVTTETVVLTLVARTLEPPMQSVGGEIPIPTTLARGLAADGWDLDLRLNTDPTDPQPEFGYVNHPSLVGYATTRLVLRAQSDGLFAGTLELEHPDGRTANVEMFGRLTAGCETNSPTEGRMIVADPSTVPLCDDVMRNL